MKRALIVAAALLASVVATPPAQAADDPVMVLVVGDSITQGKVGDYTWRCRLWETLEAEGVPVDFVGPTHGVYNFDTKDYDSEGYANPACDSDHAARWGLSYLHPVHDITDLVREYQPDVVVNMLGTNDLVWYHRTPYATAGDAVTFIDEARAVDPAVRFVMGEVTPTWFEDFDTYNWWVREIAKQREHVAVATRPTDYTQGDTWDNVHPNESGERKIAASVADRRSRPPSTSDWTRWAMTSVSVSDWKR